MRMTDKNNRVFDCSCKTILRTTPLHRLTTFEDVILPYSTGQRVILFTDPDNDSDAGIYTVESVEDLFCGSEYFRDVYLKKESNTKVSK